MWCQTCLQQGSLTLAASFQTDVVHKFENFNGLTLQNANRLKVYFYFLILYNLSASFHRFFFLKVGFKVNVPLDNQINWKIV